MILQWFSPTEFVLNHIWKLIISSPREVRWGKFNRRSSGREPSWIVSVGRRNDRTTQTVSIWLCGQFVTKTFSLEEFSWKASLMVLNLIHCSVELHCWSFDHSGFIWGFAIRISQQSEATQKPLSFINSFCFSFALLDTSWPRASLPSIYCAGRLRGLVS